jgi:hypothetical protein
MNEIKEDYMPTKEVKSKLKVQACDVMHLREAGQMQFTKKGNAFWYLRSDVEKLVKDKSK